MMSSRSCWEDDNNNNNNNDNYNDDEDKLDPEVYALWHHGVNLWENESAYLEAMEVLGQAVGNIPYVAAAVQPTNDDNDDHILLSPRRGHGNIRVTELLLFLAGCCLDAQDYHKARLYCRCAWQKSRVVAVTNNNDHDDASAIVSSSAVPLPHRILSEYISSYEEDPSLKDSWEKSYQIVQTALNLLKDENNHNANIGVVHWHSPWQRPAFCHPHIAKEFRIPVCPREHHPSWCRALEDQYGTILEEFLQLSCHPDVKSSSFPDHWPRVGDGSHREGAGSHDGSVVMGNGDWREYVLFGSGSTVDHHSGVVVAPHKTRAWLRQHVPDAVRLAEQGGGEIIFSVLKANTWIAPHCASTNLRWTAHLGLVGCSEDAKIRVADQWYTWKHGQVLVFDDSYEHEVRNDSFINHRAVLLLRFWHPGIPKSNRAQALQQALEWKHLEEEQRFHPPLPPPPKYC